MSSTTGIASKGTVVSFSAEPVGVGFLKSTSVSSDAFGNAVNTFVFTDIAYVGQIQFHSEVSGLDPETTVLEVID